MGSVCINRRGAVFLGRRWCRYAWHLGKGKSKNIMVLIFGHVSGVVNANNRKESVLDINILDISIYLTLPSSSAWLWTITTPSPVSSAATAAIRPRRPRPRRPRSRPHPPRPRVSSTDVRADSADPLPDGTGLPPIIQRGSTNAAPGVSGPLSPRRVPHRDSSYKCEHVRTLVLLFVISRLSAASPSLGSPTTCCFPCCRH